MAIVGKEAREALRDPIYLVVAIVVPLVVTTLLALGFVLDVKDLPVAFYDEDHSPLSRDYMYSCTNSEYFRLVKIAGSARELDRLLESGEVRAAIIIPPDFSRRLNGSEPASVHLLVDGTFPNRALIASGYLTAIDAQFSARLLAAHLAAGVWRHARARTGARRAASRQVQPQHAEFVVCGAPGTAQHVHNGVAAADSRKLRS